MKKIFALLFAVALSMAAVSQATAGFNNAPVNRFSGSGGSGTPAGSSGDIQTNNAGAFGAFTPGTGIQTFLTTPSSANFLSAVTDFLSSAKAFTGQQNFASAPITSTSNHIAWDLNTAQVARHTFTENTTLDNPTNMVAGGTYIIIFTQHASSPKTLAYGNAYKWPAGTVPVISATNGAVDIYTFISDGTHMFGAQQQAFQ